MRINNNFLSKHYEQYSQNDLLSVKKVILQRVAYWQSYFPLRSKLLSDSSWFYKRFGPTYRHRCSVTTKEPN